MRLEREHDNIAPTPGTDVRMLERIVDATGAGRLGDVLRGLS